MEISVHSENGAQAVALSLSRDGHYAAVGYKNGTLSVWDLERSEQVALLGLGTPRPLTSPFNS